MILQADIILSNVRDGTPGQNGASTLKSFAFKRSDSDISGRVPIGGTWDNPVPNGWSDGVPAGRATLWQTVSTFTKDAGGNVTHTVWTPPAKVANTSDLAIMYSEQEDKPAAPTSDTPDGTVWKAVAAENTIWMAMRVKKDGVWQNWTVTRIKGEQGENGANGANGANAVQYELQDNGSTAGISISGGATTLAINLSYTFWKIDGGKRARAQAASVVCDLDGQALTYRENGLYTRSLSKTYTSKTSLPASVVVSAKVGGDTVATSVCKVTMSNAAYWDVDNKLGTITARVLTAEGNISTLFSDGNSIRASIQSISNPNMLLNSGFGLGSGGVPDYWEIWDDNKKNPTVRTQNADECVVTVKEAGNFQGVSQTRKMILHSPLRLTFSCWAKGNGLFTVLLHKRDGTNVKQEVYTQQLGSGYTKQVVAQFLIDSIIDSWKLMLGFRTPKAGDSVTFRNPKLEMGDTATAYCENGNDRVLATGMDIENGLVEFTANKFNIRDNYGNQMFAVETGGTGGTASRVKLRNLAMSGLTIRDMVTMETWGDVRKYFTFDTKELTSGLRFETCLNTFRLSKRDGKSCLLGREEGETADSIKMFNVLLPCQDYFEPATDEYLAYMEEAMRYVGNRIVILNESGYRIAVYGRQEVTHMTTYTVWDSDASTPAKAAPTTSTQPQDLRPVKGWDGSAQGYYIPTDKIHDQKRDYTMQKVWTSDEYWVVPDGSMAVMECVCDICAPYDAQGATVGILEQPPMGQSVFWNVRVGKILKING